MLVSQNLRDYWIRNRTEVNNAQSKNPEYKPLLKDFDNIEEELDPLPTTLKAQQRVIDGYINHGFEGADKIDADALKVVEYKAKISKTSKINAGKIKKLPNFFHNNKGNEYQKF